jgi:hypothetical protein
MTKQITKAADLVEPVSSVEPQKIGGVEPEVILDFIQLLFLQNEREEREEGERLKALGQ